MNETINEVDRQERIRLYEKFREYLIGLMSSNSQNFDKAILSLSTTLLAFSLAFIKELVDLSSAINLVLLKISWGSLTLAIILTVISFLTSQIGINIQLKHAEKYYLDMKDDYLTKRNWFKSITHILSYITAISFLLGIILTVIFVQSNI